MKVSIRATTIWLLVLTIVQSLPLLFFVVFSKTVPGTNIYAAHLADLVLLAPLLAVAFSGLFFSMCKESGVATSCPIWLRCLAIAFAVVLFEGHGMHFAANSLSGLMGHGKSAKELIDLTYFYDEQLGHWLLFVGLGGLFLSFFAFECRAENRALLSGRTDIFLLSAAGIWSGLVSTLAALEGHSAWMPMLMLAIVMPAAYRCHHGKNRIAQYPVGYYLMVMLTTSMIVLALWLMRFHGLLEPIGK